ncbi:14-3-3 protein gamma-2-like [Teleopsis dalmanni]|uniref:14-3-3 protein gamma-2-like n=1 Tax=Teleopsis dalmanni TaxID=139649 RepID=UPI0018CDE802|nr:14-3-3 protein gamma-2-like [Teleopsis dalmanni]
MTSKEELAAKATTAAASGDFEKALAHMKTLVDLGEGLTKREIMLLFRCHLAYFHIQRSQLESIRSVAQKCFNHKFRGELADSYKEQKILLRDECFCMVNFLNKKLCKVVDDMEVLVTAKEIVGNCYWYLQSISDMIDRHSYGIYALEAYRDGFILAENLSPTHAIRLSFVLNYSQYLEENTQFTDVAESIVRDLYTKATKIASKKNSPPLENNAQAFLHRLKSSIESFDLKNSLTVDVFDSLK